MPVDRVNILPPLLWMRMDEENVVKSKQCGYDVGARRSISIFDLASTFKLIM